MKEYQELLKDILESGTVRTNRTGIDTIATFGKMLKFDLSKGFPILTTKKIHWKSVVHELLWFLSGSTNIGYLKDNGVRIWDEWADSDGNLGPIYGKQWRRFSSVKLMNKETFEVKKPEVFSGLHPQELDYSRNTSGLVGEIFTSNNCGKYKVLRECNILRSDTDGYRVAFDVMFLDTNFVAGGVRKDHVLNGGIKDYYYPSVCGVGCLGDKSVYQGDGDHKMLYNVWVDMVRRCYDKNNSNYNHYGNVGVFVDDRWLIYSNFFQDAKCLNGWVLKKTFPEKYSLDKDSEKRSNKYSRETCSWSNQLEQSYNTSRNRMIVGMSPEGKEYVFSGINMFAERFRLKESMIISCVDGRCDSHEGWKFTLVEDLDDKFVSVKIVDQIDVAIADIIHNSDSRRIIVNAWNPVDVICGNCALPPCHLMFQFFVVDNKLSCLFYMRSCDVFLGLPFNISSYALLTHMMAHVCGLEVGELIWCGGDVHIYENHLDQVKTQLDRNPFDLPKLELDPDVKNIDDFRFHHVKLRGYKSHPAIKAEVAV